MDKTPEIFTGKASELVESVAANCENTSGFKAGTKKNLEFCKDFFSKYIEEITSALTLLNKEDHSIVIAHLTETRDFMQEAASEVEKQLINSNQNLN